MDERRKFQKMTVKNNRDYSFVIVPIEILAIIVAIVLILVLIFSGERTKVKTFRLTGGTDVYYADETEGQLAGEPFLCEGATYIPAETLLTDCGYTMGWDSERNALVASTKKADSYIFADSNIAEVKGETLTYEHPTMIRNDVFYMPLEMFSAFSESEIYIDGDIKEVKIPVRDLLEDTSITDDYRMTDSLEEYSGVYVVNHKAGMEQLTYSEENGQRYAEVINGLAAAVPDSMVYDMLVPTMTEFYGPPEIYTDQVGGIRMIYQMLDQSVMPINVIKEMWAHADEKLYFDTDHHWTQRGAYYAYKAFIENTGYDDAELPALDAFTTDNTTEFKGSWTAELAGTQGGNELAENHEELERFLPIVGCEGDIYSDMYMQVREGGAVVINPDDLTYTTFIYGDQPLIHFHTDVANGRSLMLIKESFGDAFATWTVNNYEDIYIVDPRYWNGGHDGGDFKIPTFVSEVAGVDDILVLSYPGSTTSAMCDAIEDLYQY